MLLPASLKCYERNIENGQKIFCSFERFVSYVLNPFNAKPDKITAF